MLGQDKFSIGDRQLRYIEVVANIRVEREVEAYETMLELSTSAGRKVACFDQAIALREAIIGLLKNLGLADSDIHEGGGEASQNSWSSTKSIIHRIAIRNMSMEKLMSVMAATERHFAALPRPLFGGAKQNFTFYPPVPIYASQVSAVEALRKAIQNARKTAEVIAYESGVRLGSLISVVEHPSEKRGNSNGGNQRAYVEDMYVDLCQAENESFGSGSYTPLSKQSGSAARHFNVRYAIEEAEQGVGQDGTDNQGSNRS